jgi:hypothetical protein
MNKRTILEREIVSESVADKYEDCNLEWYLPKGGIRINPHYQTCRCTHYPIKYVCRIVNRLNNNRMEIGNCCVKRFLGEDYIRAFASLERIMLNERKPMNPALIHLVHQWGWVTDVERRWLERTWKKRKASPARIEINRRVLAELSKSFEPEGQSVERDADGKIASLEHQAAVAKTLPVEQQRDTLPLSIQYTPELEWLKNI